MLPGTYQKFRYDFFIRRPQELCSRTGVRLIVPRQCAGGHPLMRVTHAPIYESGGGAAKQWSSRRVRTNCFK